MMAIALVVLLVAGGVPGSVPLAEGQEVKRMIEPKGAVLFREEFGGDLKEWHHEGGGRIAVEPAGTLRLEVLGSRQGSVGCHAFTRRSFPDRIAIDYDLRVLKSNGLVITFLAMQGLKGEHFLDPGLPKRAGIFMDYVGKDAPLKSYHVSISRYNDKGEHTGVSNWRRNPGLHLAAQGDDLCKEVGRWYHIRLIKDGPRLQLHVDGKLAHDFTDPQTLPLPLPTEGVIGFRAIGSEVQAEVRSFTVRALE